VAREAGTVAAGTFFSACVDCGGKPGSVAITVALNSQSHA
jgi:hypothetical protein